jgi:hypothetical protein
MQDWGHRLPHDAKIHFEPIIGELYHLYAWEWWEFLSIIVPNECNFNSIWKFHLNADQIWKSSLDINLRTNLYRKTTRTRIKKWMKSILLNN